MIIYLFYQDLFSFGTINKLDYLLKDFPLF